jgi:aminoglycoside phosphotransferase (APT) family kinase protein
MRSPKRIAALRRSRRDRQNARMADELDLDELARRATEAAQTWAPGCSISDVLPLTGGASSLTFTGLVTGGPKEGERIVLKVAPPGLEPIRNRDVARQARLMRALAGAPGVRVPIVYFEDDGAPPEVSPFHAMNIVPGVCHEPILTPVPDDMLPEIPDRAFGAARMLAALHKVDPDAVGLGDEKRYTLEGEIQRWTRAFSTVDERMSARHLEAEKLLFDTMPAAFADAVCHGDYRLGNMLCDGTEVAALIDWEIWSLSDPRLDLAWFLFFTDEAKHPMATNPGPTGMPTAQALLDAYVEESGAVPANLEWFHCLIRYKEAAATALLMKRFEKAGGDAGAAWDQIPGLTVECIDRLQAFTPTP